MSTFKLPELGEGLEEGEIVSWKVKEGDSVKADQTMVEVMTDKATIEVPAPASGTVKKLFYKVGELAAVGSSLIDIEVAGEASSPKKAEETEEVAEKREATSGTSLGRASSSAASSSQGTSSGSSERVSNAGVLASPAVRRMAREKGVDLTLLDGSGDRGRVLRQDLEKTASNGLNTGSSTGALQSIAREERIPLVGISRKIAESLSKSMFTAVHFTHHDETDFTEIMKLKDEANKFAEKNGLSRVTFLPFYIKAAIAGLKRFPILNSTLDEKTNEIVIKHYYHFGVSVQTDNGLMVAVLRDCDRKSIFEIAADLKAVVDRARSNKASLQDLTGSTITITNVGNIGGLHATPVINYPETCILGMYQIKKRPVVREVNGEDQIVARPMMYTNITCDHRIIDGAIAAEFLRLVCDYLENPAKMAFY
jgi:pyruvate dehydrogenase E2 component (dihydrolipoamide acetyltransferase)